MHSEARIGNHVLLSYVDIHDEIIPDDVVLHGLKQKDGRFVVRILGTGDDPKKNLLFGLPLRETLGLDGALWSAEVYPVCATISEAVKAALNLFALAHGAGDRAAWERGEKKSLCSGFNEADPEALIAWDQRMQELVMMDQLFGMIHAGRPAS